MFVVQEDHTSTAIEIVEAKDLRQMTDVGEVELLCRGIVQDPRHAKQVRQAPVWNRTPVSVCNVYIARILRLGCRWCMGVFASALLVG